MAEFSQKKAFVRHDEHTPERIVSGAPLDDDARLDASVRPKTLAEYIGQKRVKENIAIAIEAARTRGEALDHVLLYGPPGLGKTTLAQIIANELGVVIKTSAGPLLERKRDLTAIPTSLGKKEVFFLDEIHRLQPAVAEARRALPTGCSAARAILPKCAPPGASPAKSPRNPCACSAWTSTASMKWTAT